MSWHIFDAAADRYERWYDTPKGHRVAREEQALISWLLQQVPVADRVVEIGCGTGHFTEWLRGRGTQAIGLERSPGMLSAMRRRWPDAVALLGDALHLPMRSRSVDAVLFVTALEFLEDPRQAVAEAARVARSGLILVVLNRWSLGGLSRRLGPQASQPLLGQAHDYTLSSLRALVKDAAGGRLQEFRSRNGCFPRGLWPTPSRLPAGDVIGLAAVLR
jgi:ubiquinone/menaquinone biosynthesis C-methylase UbiE